MNIFKLSFDLVLAIFVSAFLASIVMIVVAVMGFDNASPYFGVPIFILLIVSAIARFVRKVHTPPQTS